MHILRLPSLLLLTVLMALPVVAQTPDEFVSVLGRFGVMLPSAYADYRPNMDVTIGGKKLQGTSYRWSLDGDQVVITFASGSEDLEAPDKADGLLKTFRDD